MCRKYLAGRNHSLQHRWDRYFCNRHRHICYLPTKRGYEPPLGSSQANGGRDTNVPQPSCRKHMQVPSTCCSQSIPCRRRVTGWGQAGRQPCERVSPEHLLSSQMTALGRTELMDGAQRWRHVVKGSRHPGWKPPSAWGQWPQPWTAQLYPEEAVRRARAADFELFGTPSSQCQPFPQNSGTGPYQRWAAATRTHRMERGSRTHRRCSAGTSGPSLSAW